MYIFRLIGLLRSSANFALRLPVRRSNTDPGQEHPLEYLLEHPNRGAHDLPLNQLHTTTTLAHATIPKSTAPERIPSPFGPELTTQSKATNTISNAPAVPTMIPARHS